MMASSGPREGVFAAMGRLGLSLFGLERRDFEHRRQRSEADDRKRTRRRDRAMWKRIGVQSGVGVGGGRV